MKKYELLTENETGTKEKKKSREKKQKKNKVRNQLLFKKGGVAVVITALFVVGVVVFNLLFGFLAERFVLEYDFSTDKKNTLSSENISYIKNLDKDVKVIVCSSEDDYETYMSYYSSTQSIEVPDDGAYFEQTKKLIKKYAAYNRKIDLEFIDPNSSEFTPISEKYSDKLKAPGDILVISESSGKERLKALTFSDVYDITEDSTYASMGYTMQAVSGNNIENALTGAIAYVTDSQDKNVLILLGHSEIDYTAAGFIDMLKENNYTVQTNKDKLITASSLPENCSEIIIPVPTTDFSAEEIEIISDFLENDGNLRRGLSVYLSARAAYLPVFYDFLDEWGITVEEGKVFETDPQYQLEQEGPSAVLSFDSAESPTQICVTGSNVPLVASESSNGRTVTVEFSSVESTVAVPKDAADDYDAASQGGAKSYATVITSEMQPKTIDALETDIPKSYVTVFSSFFFLQSQYNEYPNVQNKEVTLTVTERNSGVKPSKISFVTKTIENESFADKVTAGKTTVMRIIFIFVIPVAVLAAGIVVYIKRRNAK